MKNWKKALWLAKFELKASALSFLLLLLVFIFFTFVITTTFDSYLNNNFVGIDAFFVLFFTVGPIWMKPKAFQVQQMGNDLIASPAVVMLSQLPIPADIIVKSRFIIYFFYTLPVQIILLVSLYLFSPSLQATIPVHTYFSFAIIWLSFGVYAGCIFPAGEAGDKLSSLKVTLYAVLYLVIGIILFTMIHLIFEYGIIQWTLIFAQNRPILSTLLSILVAVVGFIYWQSYMKQKLRKMDYVS